MKVFMIAFCLAFIGIAHAATQCFSCSSCGAAGTYNSTACPPGSDTCMSTRLIYPGGSLIMKSCVPGTVCKSTGLGVANFGFYIGCCSTNDCNAASGLVPTWSLLIASFILICALFKLNKN